MDWKKNIYNTLLVNNSYNILWYIKNPYKSVSKKYLSHGGGWASYSKKECFFKIF